MSRRCWIGFLLLALAVHRDDAVRSAAFQPQSGSPRRLTSIIVDTDAGSDDLMALAFLLSRQDVALEAITIVHGLAHVPAGARNVLRLLELAGRRDVPVFAGADRPLEEDRAFPPAWRERVNTLPGVDLPAATRDPQAQDAVSFLVAALARERREPVTLLALGPLTNVAKTLQRAPGAAHRIDRIVIMGGAVHVAGNVAAAGPPYDANRAAEWNVYVDPRAARNVLGSGARIVLIALDSTNRVPIDRPFVERFDARARAGLGRFVSQVLRSADSVIEQSIFYAWDPLAAVAVVEPAVVTLAGRHIEVDVGGETAGRTRAVAGRPPNARVAVDADGGRFERVFVAAFDSRSK